VTDETIKIADCTYERLYDDSDDLIFLPEPSPMSSPCSEYCPTYDDIPTAETIDMTQAFQQLLREQYFKRRVETTYSYRIMNNKSQRTFRKQVKEILMHVTKLLAPNDSNEVWNDIITDESDNYKSNENKYAYSTNIMGDLQHEPKVTLVEKRKSMEYLTRFGIIIREVLNLFFQSINWNILKL